MGPDIFDSIAIANVWFYVWRTRMPLTKRQLRRIIKEEKQKILNERSNAALAEIESQLRYTLAEYIDTYMMSMNMNPGDPADLRRVNRRVDDIIDTIIGA